MARLPYLDRDDLPEAQRVLLERPINLMRALVHSPGAAHHIRELAMYIRRVSPLDARLRELAILQVGYAVGSAYEYSHHAKIAGELGVTDDDIHAIGRDTVGETTHLAPLDRAVLQTAREMTEGLRVSDAAWSVLASALDPEQLVDLVVSIAVYVAVVRILGALEIDMEEEYVPYLEKFPLP